MSTVTIAFVIFFYSLATFAQTAGGSIEPRAIDVNVPYSGRDHEPKGEPGGRDAGDRGSRNSGSSSSGDLAQNSSTNSVTASPATIQFISDIYATYANMAGYSYSQSLNNQSIESHIPIEVLENEVKKADGPGLGYLGHQAAAGAAGVLRAENTSGAKEYAGRLDKVIEKDQTNLSQRTKEAISEEEQFYRGDKSQRDVVQAESNIDSAFDSIVRQGRGNRFASLTELDSAYVYTKSHLSMAKRLLNSKTRIHKGFGKERAYEIASELIQVALNTTQFAQGFRNGAEGAAVETFNGIVTISRFTFNGIRNPKQAFNQIMDVWEGLNAAAFVDTVSFMIDSSFDVMRFGTPYMQGEYFGMISVNVMIGLLPSHMVPIISRLAPNLSSNNLIGTITRMQQLTGHLGRGVVGRIYNLYAKAGGSKGAPALVAKAQALGLKTQAQLEAMGLFLNKTLTNQLGSVGDLNNLINDYSSYFRNWSSGFIIDDVLSADKLNATLVTQGRQLSYQPGSVVLRITAREKTRGLVRVHGLNNKTGRWVTFADEIKGMTPDEIKDYLNLPESPTHVSNYNTKPGEQFTISRVGQNGYGTVNGGTQLQPTRADLGPQDFTETMPIGPIYDGR
jgi:hypothetical protein